MFNSISRECTRRVFREASRALTMAIKLQYVELLKAHFEVTKCKLARRPRIN